MQQIVCNTCGEPIDQHVTYWTGYVQTVQLIDDVAHTGPQTRLDYHAEHLPGAVADSLPRADEHG